MSIVGSVNNLTPPQEVINEFDRLGYDKEKAIQIEPGLWAIAKHKNGTYVTDIGQIQQIKKISGAVHATFQQLNNNAGKEKPDKPINAFVIRGRQLFTNSTNGQKTPIDLKQPLVKQARNLYLKTKGDLLDGEFEISLDNRQEHLKRKQTHLLIQDQKGKKDVKLKLLSDLAYKSLDSGRKRPDVNDFYNWLTSPQFPDEALEEENYKAIITAMNILEQSQLNHEITLAHVIDFMIDTLEGSNICNSEVEMAVVQEAQLSEGSSNSEVEMAVVQEAQLSEGSSNSEVEMAVVQEAQLSEECSET